ncbi:hypothetical protein AOQ84DRAFT_49461 [Glonium stellatum]|uniref:Nucleoporin NUP37 n=1 Tax=Glonium stellatum TaxID=574774 RepID=A0A8E2F069_9PEZI|nr:hypothetical protein AOQ84DRAFT_49461 [Glonium stellatum]
MKPVVSRKGKATQLSYELPHRIHDSKIYPVKAPNGSTIVIYGHENGIRILWRGGRPIKQNTQSKNQPKPPQVNGTGNDSIMIIDSDDEEPHTQATSHQLPDEADFESEEEELDPEERYPSIIQQIDVSLNTEVLHIAVPRVPPVTLLRPSETIPRIFSEKIVISVACIDYSIRIITLPLGPPSAATKAKSTVGKHQSRWGEEIIEIKSQTGHQSIPSGVTMTWTLRTQVTLVDDSEEDAPDDDDEEDERVRRGNRSSRALRKRSRSGQPSENDGWDLLVASHSAELSGLLRVWRFPIEIGESKTRISSASPILPYRTQHLNSPASHVTFSPSQHPKRRHSQLLVVEPKGIVRVYDPLASRQNRSRLRSDEPSTELGAWLSAFHTAFEIPKHVSPAAPSLAHRKRILDASWASDGRSIIAILADGEWGIWDVDQSGPSPPADPSAFSLRGFVGANSSPSVSTTTSSTKPRGSRSLLAPMTPNTRRTKEESLFQGSISNQPSVARGGVSVATLHSTSGGAPEDSIILWYGSDSYRIPNLNQFWARSASGSGGSLYGPGLARIQGLNLNGEAVTTIQQFDTTTAAARMAIPRDLLVAAEHRLIILTSTIEQLGRDLGPTLFEKDRTEDDDMRRADQTLLAQGELDLGGMDRLLDSMESSAADVRTLGSGNPRKVLFAS